MLNRRLSQLQRCAKNSAIDLEMPQMPIFEGCLKAGIEKDAEQQNC